MSIFRLNPVPYLGKFLLSIPTDVQVAVMGSQMQMNSRPSQQFEGLQLAVIYLSQTWAILCIAQQMNIGKHMVGVDWCRLHIAFLFYTVMKYLHLNVGTSSLLLSAFINPEFLHF